jgi:UDP-N-acetylglucosamine 2-epimerase (non-hydrolysing)
MKILNIVGARPNFMKMAPIQRAMQKSPLIEPFLIHTGQHYDKAMSDLFFNDLELPKPDVFLGIGSASHAVQTATIMMAFEKVCLEYKPDMVLVVGDVNSTVACSIVASKLWIPITHVEAGLRSFDRKMPEEINRILTDSIADFLFVTEQSGIDNLLKEGVSRKKMHMVGNVMIDSLVYLLHKAKRSTILKKIKLNEKPFALVTLHRPSNVDSPENLTKMIEALEIIQKDINIVFPVHPRTAHNLERLNLKDKLDRCNNILQLPPIGYLDFIKLQSSATLIISDSGGIQEESTYMGIPCLTVRENTERPITCAMGTNELVGMDMDLLIKSTHQILNGEWKKGKIPPLWDGNASERIIKVLEAPLSK